MQEKVCYPIPLRYLNFIEFHSCVNVIFVFFLIEPCTAVVKDFHELLLLACVSVGIYIAVKYFCI